MSKSNTPQVSIGEDFVHEGLTFKYYFRHLYGGADYHVYKDGRYYGYLCFTIDADDQWRGRFAQPKPDGTKPWNHTYYSDDFSKVIAWMGEMFGGNK